MKLRKLVRTEFPNVDEKTERMLVELCKEHIETKLEGVKYEKKRKKLFG